MSKKSLQNKSQFNHYSTEFLMNTNDKVPQSGFVSATVIIEYRDKTSKGLYLDRMRDAVELNLREYFAVMTPFKVQIDCNLELLKNRDVQERLVA